MNARILIVDDEENMRLMLRQMFELEGHSVEEAPDAESAVARVQAGGLDILLLDVQLPGMDGLEALQLLRREDPELAVIMMSGHGSIETAVTAVRSGAFDFLTKPLGRDRTLLTLENALVLRSLEQENRRLRGVGAGEILGDSAPMVELREKIAQVAPTDARILIRGESGSGKELVARAVHRLSARSRRPFLAMNCAAVPTELVESELFGHMRGAFTGANSAREGVFEAAHGGTLFLDEIGDMPASMQAKLLRVLESGEFSRVGSHQLRRVDVRVVAATHRDLEARAKEGDFRSDLLHRLNVIPLRVPALRERPEDIPALAEFFLAEEARQHTIRARAFSAEALQHLGRHRWPGNVRELRNLVERLAILSRAERISAAEVAAELPGDEAEGGSLKEAVMAAERRAIAAALRGSGGNISEAARRLGLERSHLYKKARGLGIPLGD